MDGLQIIINVGAGIALSVIGWFARVLWEADKELRADLARLREEIPNNYVSKDDYRDDIHELKQMIRDVLIELKSKADK